MNSFFLSKSVNLCCWRCKPILHYFLYYFFDTIEIKFIIIIIINNITVASLAVLISCSTTEEQFAAGIYSSCELRPVSSLAR